jgi:tetratricopeptide (TPR) repeat protein
MDAAQLNELGVELMLAARPTGDIEALVSALELMRRAVAAADDADPERPGYLTDLCAGCVDVFDWNRDLEILAEGISAGRAALAAAPPGHPDATRRLSTLGYCLWSYAEAARDLGALAEAIEVCRRAIEVADPDDPDLGAFLANLANSLHTHYDLTADLASLAESVSIGRQAVAATEGGNPDAGMCLSNLAMYLQAVFDEQDDVAALAEAAQAARRAIDATDTGDDEHAIALANCSGVLQKLAERTGRVAELTEAIDVARRAVARTEDSHPDRAGRLSTLAIALHRLAARTGAASADSEALDFARQAVDVMPADHPEEAMYLGNLAAILRARFERSGDAADLEESVAVSRRALNLGLAVDSRMMAGVSGNFGNDLEQQFRLVGDPELLDCAVRAGRDAAGNPASGRVSRIRHLANLAILLQVSSDATGDLDALLEANALARQVVAATAEDDPALAARLNILVCGAQRLAIRTGDPAALAEAADAGRRAIAVGPQDAPERPGHVANLSITLQLAYERTGDRGLLAEALETGRLAVAASAWLGPGDRSVLLSGLSLALSAAYGRTDDPETLDEAIRLGRQAIEVGGDIAFYRPGYLSNLGFQLREQYARTGDVTVLNEAADLSRQAADALPEGHPDRGLYLSNLGSCLRSLSEAGEPSLAAEAARVSRAAVLETPPEHPDAARFQYNLGSALLALSRAAGDRAAARDARDAYRAAAASRSAAPFIRAVAARHWGIAAMLAGDSEDALTAFEQAIGLLPQIAPRRLARADREFGLHLVDRLPAEAAASAVAAGRPGRAVELLEQARGVLLAESIDNRGDMSDLRRHEPELAAQLLEVRDLLDRLDDPLALLAPPAGPQAVAAALSARQHLSEQREMLQEQWDELLTRIRAVPRFRDFLKPLSMTRLSQQACAGPVVMVYTTEWRSGALVLTGDRDDPMVLVEMPDLSEHAVYALVNEFLSTLAQAKSGGYAQRRGARSAMHEHLEALWRSIAQPVLEALRLTEPPPDADQAPRIWWCPVGVLAYLPLHAAGEHRAGGGQTVLDLAVSSYTATVRLLEHSRQRETAGRQGSAHAQPLIVAMPETPGAAPLDGVPAETIGIRAIMGETTILEDKTATSPAVCAALAQHRVAHFACHGVSDWSNPSDSRLLLHDHQDRPFTVTTVSDLQLRHAELAYLSACSTSVVAPRLTDEAVHLVSAFQVAGFRQVIGTLWGVDMSGSTQVALDVYRGLAQAGTLRPEQAARALHAAVRRVRDRHLADPAVWAGYVHAGV